MTVTSVLLWENDDGLTEEGIASAKKAKAIMEKYGGQNMRMGRILTGDNTGKWIFSTTFDNMEAYGKAMDASSNDPEFQALMASAPGRLISRTIVAGFDLD
jgi:hypothetical protein